MLISNRTKSFELFDNCVAAFEHQSTACHEAAAVLEEYVSKLITNTVF